MKVVALKQGFFDGSLREQGAVFEVPDNSKARWFAPVESEAGAKASKPKAQAKQAPKALSELEPGAKSFNDVHSDKGEIA